MTIDQIRDGLRALLEYGRHKAGCASQWRAATGSSQIGPCDCGLSAAFKELEAASLRSEEQTATIDQIRELVQAAQNAVDFLTACEWNDYTSERDACDIAHRLQLALAASLRSEGAPPAGDEQLKYLASAMRKLLPPALLAEVIAHLDPLTPFVEVLRSATAGGTPPAQEGT